ncbi:YicC/YloC family endoribonuclease [Pararhodobacter zhoushanensis]|uniref:YicC/YloC family endoribonuclease n=1 Tax=Pararhodobacter zhoushanensis TaxID=2479545 RepID=UPI000F8C7BAD|nr:YicC/YloC family endoribonuclease [Pararhodobacter zhoushanensis]
MVKSMTGFAAQTGDIATETGIYACQWDLRSVNGRGLDLRFRVPDWLDGLEAALRKRLGNRLNRGNVSLTLKLTRSDSGASMRVNAAALDAAVALVIAAETQAERQGLRLAPITAADLLAIKGVVDSGPEQVDPAPLVAALVERAGPLIDAFEAARAAEGAALAAILGGQVAAISDLTEQARAAVEARRPDQVSGLKAALARLTEAAPTLEPGRLEQELALIAVKTDVTEELDRLAAHVDAAKALLASDQPVGRKLDFLMQEFNREANTLCSKAQSAELTRIGLDLKTVIDQMREQVQNVE